MKFRNKLKEIKEQQGWSSADMAERIHVTEPLYLDFESGRIEPNHNEQIGILVSLGVPPKAAIDHATTPEMVSLTDIKIDEFSELEAKDPLVYQDSGILYISRRTGFQADYQIELKRINTEERALAWMAQLAGKPWMRREHFKSLLRHLHQQFNVNPNL